MWFGVDLGATFFVDEFFLYSFKSDEGLVGYSINGTGPGHTVLYSDGAQVLQSGLPVPGAFDYTELFTHINPNADRLLYIRYIFKPRKMRYFFWHGIRDTGWGIVKWGEFMLFSPGHPAEVVLRSPFIDLGTEAGDGRPKVIKGLHKMEHREAKLRRQELERERLESLAAERRALPQAPAQRRSRSHASSSTSTSLA